MCNGPCRVIKRQLFDQITIKNKKRISLRLEVLLIMMTQQLHSEELLLSIKKHKTWSPLTSSAITKFLFSISSFLHLFPPSLSFHPFFLMSTLAASLSPGHLFLTLSNKSRSGVPLHWGSALSALLHLISLPCIFFVCPSICLCLSLAQSFSHFLRKDSFLSSVHPGSSDTAV